MYVPKLKKLIEINSIYVERALPVPGNIYTQIGTFVKPYDHLGDCNVSHSEMNLPGSFKPVKIKGDKKYFAFGARLGKVGSEIIAAPFNGHLYKNNSTSNYIFKEIESKYTLLAGVWGNVEKINEGNSVLLRTQAIDIQLVSSTNSSFSGELIVFPNPWHTLEKYYLNEFSQGASGKIIYVGNMVDTELLKEALKMGVGGIIAGSCDKDTYNFAKSKGMSLGIFSGFGDLETPANVFDYLKTVSNRFVMFYGEKNLLRVPIPEITNAKKPQEDNVIVEIEKGMKVFILEKNYFGKTGEVEIVADSSIFVRFPKAKNTVEIKLPNFLILG